MTKRTIHKTQPHLNALTTMVLLALASNPIYADMQTTEDDTTVKKSAKRRVNKTQSDTTTLETMNVVDKTESEAERNAAVNAPDNPDYKITNAVTATKTDTPLMQTPVSVKIVSQQVMKDQQATTVEQVLSNVSGAVSGGAGTFFLRGFQNQNVYKDGFLNQSQWYHTEDLTNVERVEVLKGPGSILFDGQFNASLAYFDLTKQNLPIQIAPNVSKPVGEAESRGIEFDFSGEILPHWNVIGAYAYTPFAKTIKSGLNWAGTAPDGTEGMRLHNAPEHSGSLWTTFDLLPAQKDGDSRHHC